MRIVKKERKEEKEKQWGKRDKNEGFNLKEIKRKTKRKWK